MTMATKLMMMAVKVTVPFHFAEMAEFKRVKAATMAMVTARMAAPIDANPPVVAMEFNGVTSKRVRQALKPAMTATQPAMMAA